MKTNIILTLLIMLITGYSFGQSDTLNQRDEDGKKTGWWITYLDDNLKVLKDSAGATHCMYNYYLKNIFLHRFGEGYGSKKYPIIFPNNDTLKLDDYTLLNGVYKTKHKNGQVRSVVTASNGVLMHFKMYYPNGQLRFEIDYTVECGAAKQYCIKEYKKDGILKRESLTYLPRTGDK